ncbi:unnamed protein product [Cyprideis torosa]|uniref:BCAS3 WD40 domain-containing protein n=1 Tax=Cyprideis torosa TaxID=163714 RepID=A0A7R8ZM85_9CRUS|nr:unnamed protein product [Cyprideis torosa]CAG0893638.1 unnamed protein product [Cyprideis torosa]
MVEPMAEKISKTVHATVWLIPPSGEAVEVLSWRQGSVRFLTFLTNPSSSGPTSDLFAQSRPLIAICDSSGPGAPFTTLNLISLRTGVSVKQLTFKSPACELLSSPLAITVLFADHILVLSALTLEELFSVSRTASVPDGGGTAAALGVSWLAYADVSLFPNIRSSGGFDGAMCQQSYTSSMISAARSLTKGIQTLGESVAQTLSASQHHHGHHRHSPPSDVCYGDPLSSSPPSSHNSCGSPQGIITVVDIASVPSSHPVVDPSEGAKQGIILHFPAHFPPLTNLVFDRSGALLLSADVDGRSFHLFRLQPQLSSTTAANAQHLYILTRGETTARVTHLSFSPDARWAAAATLRGTLHVFPVSPYGGQPTARTHLGPRVVNRLSRFQRSAGLDEVSTGGIANSRRSPVPRLSFTGGPITLFPLAQLKHPSPALKEKKKGGSVCYRPTGSTLFCKLASLFSSVSRSWALMPSNPSPGGGNPAAASPNASLQRRHSLKGKRYPQHLYTVGTHGSLIEYALLPKVSSGSNRVGEETPIELQVETRGEWSFLPPLAALELHPPLSPSNPLLTMPLMEPVCRSSKPRNLKEEDESWVAHVEINTYQGPHRRLWMGPQFRFRPKSALISASESSSGSLHSLESGPDLGGGGGMSPFGTPPATSVRPVMIPYNQQHVRTGFHSEAHSAGSGDSVRLFEIYGERSSNSEGSLEPESVEVEKIREDLAEAMIDQEDRADGRRESVDNQSSDPSDNERGTKSGGVGCTPYATASEGSVNEIGLISKKEMQDSMVKKKGKKKRR